MTAIVVHDGDINALYEALQTLKGAGGRMEDGRFLWCSNELLQIKELGDGNPTARASSATAKLSLAKLKSVSIALNALSKSLDEAVQRITDRYTRLFRISGFKSLPDELIARIFELHHEEERKRFSKFNVHLIARRSSNVLASVCKRFRRIALRLPGLWEEVSDTHAKDWIVTLRGRTEHPLVYIRRFPSDDSDLHLDSLKRYFQLLHPSNQWKGLSIRYWRGEVGSSIFKSIRTELKGELCGVETLHLDRESTSCDDEEDTEDDRPSTMLSEDDLESMSEWDLSNLKRLFVRNIIPRTLDCCRLTELNMTFARLMSPLCWDLFSLKAFLRCLYFLESLSLTFSGGRLPSGDTIDHDDHMPAAKLLRLASFTLKIEYYTEAAFVKSVIDIFDAPILSTFSVSLRYKSLDEKEPGPKAWLDAIFNLPVSPTQSVNRTFANAETFSLVIVDESQRHLPYESMLRAFPRLRDLDLELPECHEPPLYNLARRYGCLKDLRSLHLKNCSSVHGSGATVNYFKALSENGKIKDFEGLKIERCPKFSGRKDALQKILGDKLVWKD